MQFIPSNVLSFFAHPQRSYEIPVYQRAYSWEKENWKTFIDDLLEQINGNNNYFFGNLLLEVTQKNKKYEIIDGQQRITTLSIFMRSLINVLTDRHKIESFEFNVLEKEQIYLKTGGNIKLRPVEYDRACFDSLIVDNNKQFELSSPSQTRIKAAKDYFEQTLSKLATDTILQILDKIENTDLTIIELEGKKDSALMFELENNRGKELTNMEKIKSYFMYQMYVFSPQDHVDTNIESISNIFKNIYFIINEIGNLSEDAILTYHNNAYVKGYAYRSLDDVKEILKKSENKVEWIKDYVSELHTTFSNLKKFERENTKANCNLLKLGVPAYIYPFIIKGYKYIQDKNELLNLLNVLEILTFRAKLINSRANIQERLNAIMLAFEGNVYSLKSAIKEKLNDSWYWGDNNTKKVLCGNLYGNNVLNYLLWRYENALQNKGYGINEFSISNEQIEHISPRKPTNGDPIETGYDVDDNNEYSEEFMSNKLNCIGNLMLISGSHNASIGNKPFKDKLSSYISNPLLNQQTEIQEFSESEDGKPVWKESSINKRQNKIVNFAMSTWRFD
ncbi:DUF262 domain-containing protein [Thalassotalea sediminis]|uniref:DUF262 domain-containing protein n=1 Tax=Thalassotalea sediminis TaxID=1759089 RepID=UPI002574824C|nr:DUF262 domain-containing HNH endonuclease family protein [Thalassotalea sediminis]